ncbi:hypothetical protein LTS17_008553 [Exophiala oligosperma]
MPRPAPTTPQQLRYGLTTPSSALLRTEFYHFKSIVMTMKILTKRYVVFELLAQVQGQNELVLSNHVDVVEAQTISSLVEISHWDENDDSNKKLELERFWRQPYDMTSLVEVNHWDENDDSNKKLLLERYWRQTYDMKQKGDNALSKLR